MAGIDLRVPVKVCTPGLMWRTSRHVALTAKTLMTTSFPICKLALLPTVRSHFASTAFLEPADGGRHGAAHRAPWKTARLGHCFVRHVSVENTK